MSMNSYYTGRRARHYNTRWRTYTRRTVAEVLAMIDFAALRSVPERLGRPPRVLDIACGTGILLKELLERVPGIEVYEVDASADMLAQARIALKGQPRVQLEQVEVGAGETANLPYTRGSFDLITFTNALHDMPEPVGILERLMRPLTPGGQLVVEDLARREPVFLLASFESLLQRLEGSRVHAFTWPKRSPFASRQDFMVPVGDHSPSIGCGMAGCYAHME
jgi:ubiquinone/menaquinone biosynthesis C-methylase UbiE